MSIVWKRRSKAFFERMDYERDERAIRHAELQEQFKMMEARQAEIKLREQINAGLRPVKPMNQGGSLG